MLTINVNFLVFSIFQIFILSTVKILLVYIQVRKHEKGEEWKAYG